MSDVKVYIDAGNELHGAVVETDSYIVNISRQYARIFSYDDYLSSSGVAEPSAQPTSLVFSSVTSSGMTLTWTAASPAVDGYIVLRSTSAITDVPVDLNNYSVNDTIGAATVEYLGADVTFGDAGLSAYTLYYYSVFSYNGTTGTYNFLTTAPLTGSQITLYNFLNTLHFDGSNDYVIGSVNNFNFNVSTYTLACWIKMDAVAATQTIIGWTPSSTRGWGIEYTSTGRMYFKNSTSGTGGGCYVTYSTTATWAHWGMVWNSAGATNADKLKVYLNGALQSPTYFGTLALTGLPNVPLRMGANTAGTANFDGYLDDAAIWSDNDPTHITNHYNSGNGATPDASALIMHCKFNESNNSATTADETGTNTFTLTNFNYDANSGFDLRT